MTVRPTSVHRQRTLRRRVDRAAPVSDPFVQIPISFGGDASNLGPPSLPPVRPFRKLAWSIALGPPAHNLQDNGRLAVRLADRLIQKPLQAGPVLPVLPRRLNATAGRRGTGLRFAEPRPCRPSQSPPWLATYCADCRAPCSACSQYRRAC